MGGQKGFSRPCGHDTHTHTHSSLPCCPAAKIPNRDEDSPHTRKKKSGKEQSEFNGRADPGCGVDGAAAKARDAHVDKLLARFYFLIFFF